VARVSRGSGKPVDEVVRGTVVGEHDRGEPIDAPFAGSVRQSREQNAAEALTLELVADDDRELSRARILAQSYEPRDRDDAAGFGGRAGDEREVTLAVQVGEVAQLLAAETGFDRQEPLVLGFGGQASIGSLDARSVIGSNRPDPCPTTAVQSHELHGLSMRLVSPWRCAPRHSSKLLAVNSAAGSAPLDFDVVVVGLGPGGRAVAPALAAGGRRVAAIESELVGGECPYWACIPSKALLRGPDVAGQAARVRGVSPVSLDWPAVRAYRDYMNSGLDDGAKARAIVDAGVTLLRGQATDVQPGGLLVDGRRLTAADIVIATGSSAVIPDISGLDRSQAWTNREATTLTDIPTSVAVLGAGPVGIECAQYLAAYGARVTILERGARPLAREDPEVSALLVGALADAGIQLRCEASVESVTHGAGSVALDLADGSTLTVERLLLASGRAARTQAIAEGAVRHSGTGAISVDERCCAGDGLWAVGDVTGVAPFTHVAGYQGRVVVEQILGGERRADYRAVPRVVFCEPQIAAVGLTAEGAVGQGVELTTAALDLGDADRTEIYGHDLSGRISLSMDSTGAVVGASAVGPEAGEWIHTPALAIHAGLNASQLADFIPQFPTFSELWAQAARKLIG
jgi:pyruvate/2-oxoglutarate dehydrogenase complex dihydrolipoamide dehydrogenase (E3) component